MQASVIESRSLNIGKWGNLLMAAAGVTTAYLSRSDAILVDGLFSAVNFASAMIAVKVSVAVMQPRDRFFPWGYEAYESLYVMFRSLILVGITLFAGLGAIGKIITYASGGQVPEVLFGPIVIYTIAMTALCLGLAAWHRWNWTKSGKQSELLKVESNASFVDGCISAGSGVALLGAGLLTGTPLAFLMPIADSIIVLFLSIVIVNQPLTSMRKALREVAGGAADPELSDRVRQRTEACLAGRPFELVEVVATKLGRIYTVVPYVKPSSAVLAEQVDELRDVLHDEYATLLNQVRVEVLVTAQLASPSDSNAQPAVAPA